MQSTDVPVALFHNREKKPWGHDHLGTRNTAADSYDPGSRGAEASENEKRWKISESSPKTDTALKTSTVQRKDLGGELKGEGRIQPQRRTSVNGVKQEGETSLRRDVKTRSQNALSLGAPPRRQGVHELWGRRSQNYNPRMWNAWSRTVF